MMKNYVVRAALHEEASCGWVWLDDIPSRTIVKIRDSETQCSIYCEVRELDTNFISRYNQHPRIDIPANRQPTIILAKWYRDALGIKETTAKDNSTKTRTLDIQPARFWGWRALRAASHHPDTFVRLSTRLGVLGAWLGVVGLVLGVAPLIDIMDPNTKIAIFTALPVLFAGLGVFACRETNQRG